MLFSTDQQTINDLNIFGKHSGNSVYGIFNRTFTRGGAALLEEMFRNPLSNAASINKRTSLIRYFAALQTFPFDTELFDIIEQYLANRDERTKISAEGDQFSSRISQLVLDDTNYKFINKGVTASIQVVWAFKDFLAQHKLAQASIYEKEHETIDKLLDDPALKTLTREEGKGRLSYAKLAEYDQILRFRYREIIQKILGHIYNLDVYISVGQIAAERRFIFPVASDDENEELLLEGLYHPHVENAVANDLHLGHSGNVIFLTGANMAGKSTFMKSLGTALYLAHMGFPVPATKMEFPVFDGIYTTINLPDNLGMGNSHFYAEVLRIKKIAAELNLSKRLFVIIDELFRGTNVKDAYEATVAITGAFAGKRDSMFVISTHIVEAGETLMKKNKNIIFQYMPTRMSGNKPVYTYRLQTGITADRHGMVIIHNEGILDILKQGIQQLNNIAES
ncbi:MutS-related protein [Pedobacter antarcticus]|uniref:MutS-related protein n=1 Tax=Pedobacter antarcticus TaxID=34086 RepID=UPI00292CD1EF|nr:DNA mismatch repair protein [Pedobacter antarcticus]